MHIKIGSTWFYAWSCTLHFLHVSRITFAYICMCNRWNRCDVVLLGSTVTSEKRVDHWALLKCFLFFQPSFLAPPSPMTINQAERSIWPVEKKSKREEPPKRHRTSHLWCAWNSQGWWESLCSRFAKERENWTHLPRGKHLPPRHQAQFLPQLTHKHAK